MFLIYFLHPGIGFSELTKVIKKKLTINYKIVGKVKWIVFQIRNKDTIINFVL